MPLTVSTSTEFVINPNGKSEVCILHEYMQRVLKVRPVYNFFDCGKLFDNLEDEKDFQVACWINVRDASNVKILNKLAGPALA